MLTKYIEGFEKLRSDISRARWSSVTHYRAPHKPLLLLAVLDAFAQGTIKSNLIEITPDLCETFTLYWTRVMPPGQRSNIAMPFFHLTSDGFWHLVPRPGKEAIVEAKSRLRSVNELNEVVLGAKLDDELYNLLQVSESRDILRSVLIDKYFAEELRPGLLEQSVVNTEAYAYSQELLKQVRQQSMLKITDEDVKPAVRDQAFRRAVVTAYDYRCSMCGIRIFTANGHTVVDAAHIIPWSVSRNDDPRNGMSLCRLCHWNFDEGMLGVSQQYVVITSRQLSADRNMPGHVALLAGRNIIEPVEEVFMPDLDALDWHQRNVFRHR